MARPIRETPILFGEDARRFEAHMLSVNNGERETEEKKREIMSDYHAVMSVLQK